MTETTRQTSGFLLAAASILSLLLIGFSCSDSSSTTEAESISCSGVSLTYVSDVSPVIVASCAKSGCHGSGSNNGPGPLVTYAQVYAARNEIYSSVSSGEMPKDGRLSTNEKSIILCWIQNGASDN